MAGLLGAATATAARADDYVVITTNLSGTDAVEIHGINIHGQMAGCISVNNKPHAFIWLPEDDASLGLDAGINLLDDDVTDYHSSIAYDINDEGVVVGWMKFDPGSGGDQYPYVWDLSGNHTSTEIGAPGLAAFDINNDANPLIVGGLEDKDGDGIICATDDGFAYDLDNDDLVTLPTTEPATRSIAYGISDTNGIGEFRIAGQAILKQGAFGCGTTPSCWKEIDGQYWKETGAVAELGANDDCTADEPTRVVGRAVNQVNSSFRFIGFANNSNDPLPNGRARRYAATCGLGSPSGSPTLLPRIDGTDQGDAFDIRGIDTSGPMEIVGWSTAAEEALLWSWNGSSWDLVQLNDATCTDGTIDLRIATGINENGWICGHTNGVGWLLIPASDYESMSCLADIANDSSQCPDGVVNLFDLLLLLDNWGSDDKGASIAAPLDVVNLFDLLDLIDAWGKCVQGAAAQVYSIEDEVTGAGLTMNDWDDFMDVMTDPYEDDEVKENWSCWMKNTLSACPLCPPCPGQNPFK